MSSQTWPTVTPVNIPSAVSGSSPSTLPDANNPLPQLLHTPSGLAIIELQGTINFPQPSSDENPEQRTEATEVGRLVFPLYTPGISDPNSGAWMKRVYFYVGKHQRMTGEIKKLAKPMAVLKKAKGEDEGAIEVAEIIKHKIVFGSRPEPVSADMQ